MMEGERATGERPDHHEKEPKGHAVGGQDGGSSSFHLSLCSILDLAYGVMRLVIERKWRTNRGNGQSKGNRTKMETEDEWKIDRSHLTSFGDINYM